MGVNMPTERTVFPNPKLDFFDGESTLEAVNRIFLSLKQLLLIKGKAGYWCKRLSTTEAVNPGRLVDPSNILECMRDEAYKTPDLKLKPWQATGIAWMKLGN